MRGNPREYVDGAPSIRVLENGPVRIALEITRNKAGSRITQIVRLYNGGASDIVEVYNDVDWRTYLTLFKASFPLSASNPEATYDLGIGSISRGNDTDQKYEVPAQQWADITDKTGEFGVSILSTCKYGWDKPEDNRMRRT